MSLFDPKWPVSVPYFALIGLTRTDLAFFKVLRNLTAILSIPGYTHRGAGHATRSSTDRPRMPQPAACAHYLCAGARRAGRTNHRTRRSRSQAGVWQCGSPSPPRQRPLARWRRYILQPPQPSAVQVDCAQDCCGSCTNALKLLIGSNAYCNVLETVLWYGSAITGSYTTSE